MSLLNSLAEVKIEMDTLGFCTIDSSSSKQEKLQACLLAVHNELRQKYKEISNGSSSTSESSVSQLESEWKQAWKAHTENTAVLEEYSKAMYELAADIWAPRNTLDNFEVGCTDGAVQMKCRIQWVIAKVKTHFSDTISQRKLSLLDVGSCYNPFSIYSDILDIVPIDLCPAPQFRKHVYQADFLSIDCMKSSVTQLKAVGLPDGTKRLKSLCFNSFDLVVFSFFLEYLPDVKQRLESCRRAYNLLRPGGILFILRPDSKPVTPLTMKFIKELKVGLACLGLKRLYCEKLEHLWGMGFLKLTEEEKIVYMTSTPYLRDRERVDYSSDNLRKLFSIPQDFNQKVEPSNPKLLTHSVADPFLFDELPLSEL